MTISATTLMTARASCELSSLEDVIKRNITEFRYFLSKRFLFFPELPTYEHIFADIYTSTESNGVYIHCSVSDTYHFSRGYHGEFRSPTYLYIDDGKANSIKARIALLST